MAELSDVVAGASAEAVRVVLRHEARRRFRPLFLVEATLVLLSCVCLIPVAILLATQHGEALDFDLDTLFRRAWHRWHAVVVELRAQDGAVLATAEHAPATDADGEALVASVLRVADAQGLVVVETSGTAEVLTAWYGGQPLMVLPHPIDIRELIAVLETTGAQVTSLDPGHRVSWTSTPQARWLAGLGLVLLSPLQVWTQRGRAGLWGLWQDLLGRLAGTVSFEITPAAIVHRQGRADRVTQQTVPTSELLGVAWSAGLGFDPVVRQPPSLRLFTRSGGTRLGLPTDPGAGPVLRDLILLTQGAARGARQTRCPYCGTDRQVAEHSNCISCGGPSIIR